MIFEHSSLLSAVDFDFFLHGWLSPDDGSEDRDAAMAMFDVATRLAEDQFLSHYKSSDSNEPRLVDGEVVTLPAIGEALALYREMGFFGASFAEALGGGGLSHLLGSAIFAQFAGANVATAAYPMLARANARLLTTFASNTQIETFAKPQIVGEWLGTMCLSEPQAGSDLSLVRTKAIADGEDRLGKRFRLFGNKMWISGADHVLAPNIVHLVLAKIPLDDGSLPSGTGGISLFIVPKVLPDGRRNDVAVAGLNHKMGYRGTVNCALNFGEQDGAVGWLVGEPRAGMRQMFQMLNEARLNVGIGGAALAHRGYALSVQYARSRLQGRASGTREGLVPIIEHADVRHMLLAQKAYAEGALALCLYCAALIDRGEETLLGLLTPIAKTWPGEYGLLANQLAIQVHGGYGYTRDFDVEQIYRDNRINPIHDGTTGIQAIDLLGRKILTGDSLGMSLLERSIGATITAALEDDGLRGMADDLGAALMHTRKAIAAIEKKPAPEMLDNATFFLRGLGHVVVAWLWLDQLIAVQRTPERWGGHFVEGKRAACRYFFEIELPQAMLWLNAAAANSDLVRSAGSEIF